MDILCEQYQEAQDPQIPFAQRHRPEVQEKPQACAARYNEGVGTLDTGIHTCGRNGLLTTAQKEVKEGKRDAA